MSIKLLLPFFLGVSLTSAAQDREYADSLRYEIARTDSVLLKISAYSDLCWEYATTRTKLDSALMYADSVRALSARSEYEKGIALSHFYFGLIDRFKGNYYQGIDQMEQFIEYSRQQGDSARMVSGLFQYAVMHANLGNYQKSLNAYYRVFNIHQSNDNKDGMGFTLHSIGNMQRKLGKIEDAIKSYEESVRLKKITGDKGGIWMSHVGLGNAHSELMQYDKAEQHYNEALLYARQTDESYGLATVYENMGNLYSLQANYRKALEYLKKSLFITEQLPTKAQLAYIKTEVGEAYLALGHLDSAETILLESLNILDRVKSKPLQADNYEALAALYEERNDYEKAFQYQKLHTQIKDSILNTDMARQLAEMETKYQTRQKNHEIDLLTRENALKAQEAERQADIQKAIVIVALLIVLIAGLTVYALRQKLKNQRIISAKDREIKMARLREELSSLEMKALRAQMNPHFLFNCINSINQMILSEDNENASRYLTKFSRLIRLMLENSEHQNVSLQDELSMLKTYIELEAIRFNDKITCNLDIDKSIDLDNTLIPSMILQPFVENAIWHGLLPKDKKGTIKISISEEGDYLRCNIIDDGIGREASMELNKESRRKKSSMGIKITTDRLKLMSREKFNKLVDIVDLKDDNNTALGTQVKILIPLA